MTNNVPNSVDREIGGLQSAVHALTEAMKTQASYHERMLKQQSDQYDKALVDFRQMIKDANTEITSLRLEIEEMKGILQQAKGSWKTLTALATISAAIGAFLAKIGGTFYWAMPR